MSKLLIVGGGGHASDLLSVIESIRRSDASKFSDVLVFDDEWSRRDRFLGRDVTLIDDLGLGLGQSQWFVLGVGYPGTRRLLVDRIGRADSAPSPSIVDPASTTGFGVRLGPGSVVFGHVWLSPHVSVGSHGQVSYGCTVGHDCEIGSFVSLMPGCRVSGDVSIGEGAMIGAGATILQGVTIGSGAVIGAGAVVTTHVEPGGTYVGVPARRVGKTRT